MDPGNKPLHDLKNDGVPSDPRSESLKQSPVLAQMMVWMCARSQVTESWNSLMLGHGAAAQVCWKAQVWRKVGHQGESWAS